MGTIRRTGAKAGAAESNNSTHPVQSIRLVKRRRKRGTSLDAEIKTQAKKIYESGMASAYQAAVLTIVGKKLDEIATILRAAGIQGVMGATVVGPQPVVRPAPQSTGPACVQCGMPAVRRGKPNKWNQGNPPWYCRIHQALAGQIEAEDARDDTIIGPQPGAITKKPVVTQSAPVQMVAQAEAPTESEDGLMAALGVAVGEEA